MTKKAVSNRVIGLMSGSSLDGLDIACCDFHHDAEKGWGFTITHAACVPFDSRMLERLRAAVAMSGHDLWQLHADFGRFSGQAVKDFIAQKELQDILCIGSHGHTVFHYPDKKFTTQIGDGAALAYAAGIPTICDFRAADIAKGGQGAPLVPIGDRLLFGQYRFLLNIGGIANITCQDQNGTQACDIASANQILNHYARMRGQEYDDGGTMAAQGVCHAELLAALNALPFYAVTGAKSLDNGYSGDVLVPLIDSFSLSVPDVLHTYCEHLTLQIARQIGHFNGTAQDTVLVSGGGAYNRHLIDRLRHHVPISVLVPDDNVIQYKEALIFAFMALLRWHEKENIYASVTGATTGSCAGAVYLP